MSRMDPKVLDGCLHQIQSGQATLEDCLLENSVHAEALEPLLRMAAVTHAELSPPGPSKTFLTHSPKRVMNLTKARLKASSPTQGRRPKLILRPAYRLAGALLSMALLFGSVGVAYASEDALPGDNLYGVKRGLERAALAVSLSAEGDAALWLKHADRRIDEVEELVRRGREADIGPALEGYEKAVRKGLENASEHGAVLGDFETALDNHQQVLAGMLAGAPEHAIPGLTHALENSKKRPG